MAVPPAARRLPCLRAEVPPRWYRADGVLLGLTYCRLDGERYPDTRPKAVNDRKYFCENSREMVYDIFLLCGVLAVEVPLA